MSLLTKKQLEELSKEIDLDNRETKETGIELYYKMEIGGKHVSFWYELDFSEVAGILRRITRTQYDVNLDGMDDDIFNMFVGLGVNIEDDVIGQNEKLAREIIKDNVQAYVEEAYQDYLDNEAELKKYEEEE